MPDELVSKVNQYGLHSDSPNLQDGCNMASPQMVLHMGHIGQHFHDH